MKTLICTRADENIQQMCDIAHPLFKNYAEKCGADFQVLDHISGCTKGNGRYHYRIMLFKELLQEYDRVLHLDTDMVLNVDCPNIFDVVPEGSIGTLYEDKGSRQPDRQGRMKAVQRSWGDINWTKGYINTGVFLVSKAHENIFETHNGNYWTGPGEDDVHLGYKLNQYNHPVHELEFKWNHMTMFSEGWNNKADRFKSNIIHYAGRGIFDAGCPTKIRQMQKDYAKIYQLEEVAV